MTSEELRHIAKALLTYADEMDGKVIDVSKLHQPMLITGVHGTACVKAGEWDDISRIATLDIEFDIDPNYIFFKEKKEMEAQNLTTKHPDYFSVTVYI